MEEMETMRNNLRSEILEVIDNALKEISAICQSYVSGDVRYEIEARLESIDWALLDDNIMVVIDAALDEYGLGEALDKAVMQPSMKPVGKQVEAPVEPTPNELNKMAAASVAARNNDAPAHSVSQAKNQSK